MDAWSRSPRTAIATACSTATLACACAARQAASAWFRTADGLRPFHPGALPAHSGAFAVTVHKAQGSEFDRVWLLLPQYDARTLSRELLYTALTRARNAVHVCANEAVLRATLSRHVVRISGLTARLRPRFNEHSPHCCA